MELCLEHSPDFLILDLHMFIFNGFFTLKKLSEIKNSSKKIVVTGLLDNNALNELNYYAPFESFTKSFNPIQLGSSMIEY